MSDDCRDLRLEERKTPGIFSMKEEAAPLPAEPEERVVVVDGLGEGGRMWAVFSNVGGRCVRGEVLGDKESTLDRGPVDVELRYVSRLGAESSDEGWKDVR